VKVRIVFGVVTDTMNREKRLRKCKNCGSKFSPDDGFIRRRFQKEHIVEAVYLYQDGLSLSKVKDNMWQHHGVKVSRWMILLWCRDYSRIISNQGVITFKIWFGLIILFLVWIVSRRTNTYWTINGFLAALCAGKYYGNERKSDGSL
jgi:hypothetical protein